MMTTIHYNVPGGKRKELVKAIAAWTCVDFSYAGVPTFAYHADGMEIDRNGNLKLLDTKGGEAIERLMQHLHDEGFECDMSEETLDEEESKDIVHLDVSVPADTLDETAMQNLEALVASKGGLLKKALGVDELPILNLKGDFHFPWFDITSTAEEAQTYTKLVSKMIEMAKNAKRVNSKEKEATNPKYEFRCFLLRLGFIGDEYKTDRKTLLKNLSGSSAFKGGSKGGEQ